MTVEYDNLEDEVVVVLADRRTPDLESDAIIGQDILAQENVVINL